jgi:GNAT superfamily N-acetyltransferase
MSPSTEAGTSCATAGLRRAVAADAPALAAMRHRFRTVDHPGRGRDFETAEAFAARCVPWMEAALGSDAWRCWVIELPDGSLGGQLWLQTIAKIPNPTIELETLAYVTNVYVLPELRGRGLASALLDAALAWCRAHEVDQAILWPSPKSRPLYARHGFSASDAVMTAPLGPGH